MQQSGRNTVSVIHNLDSTFFTHFKRTNNFSDASSEYYQIAWRGFPRTYTEPSPFPNLDGSDSWISNLSLDGIPGLSDTDSDIDMIFSQ